jgi:hypothetical protein
MLGVLAMIFAVLAFAEKTREDGHLPERSGRGSGERPSLAVATGLAVIMVPAYRVQRGRAEQPPELSDLRLCGDVRGCPGIVADRIDAKGLHIPEIFGLKLPGKGRLGYALFLCPVDDLVVYIRDVLEVEDFLSG